MDEVNDGLDPVAEPEAPPAPRPKAPPIESRFLFVDIAAMRAKQLRRGALPRLDDDQPEADIHRPTPHKAERVAMEEVRRGLVLYDVPAVPRAGEPTVPNNS
jgi:DNA-directed RNA polymerase subunit K/omega